MRTETFRDYLTVGLSAAEKMTPYLDAHDTPLITSHGAYRSGFRDALCWAADYLKETQITGLPTNALRGVGDGPDSGLQAKKGWNNAD